MPYGNLAGHSLSVAHSLYDPSTVFEKSVSIPLDLEGNSDLKAYHLPAHNYNLPNAFS